MTARKETPPVIVPVVVTRMSDPVKMAIIAGVFAFLSSALVAIPVIISARASAQQAAVRVEKVAEVLADAQSKTAESLEELHDQGEQIHEQVNSNMKEQIAHVARLEAVITSLRQELLDKAEAKPE